MSNKDSIVAQSSEGIVSHTASHSDAIVFDEEKRQKVIQILRQIPAIVDSAKKLHKGKTYQAVISPEVLKRIKDGSASLDEKGDGLFGALVRDAKSGRLIDHVDLREVKPDLLGSLNQVATQQTLADIAHRLEVIDEKITDVLQGQTNDRLAEVKSGIRMYKDAVLVSDPDVRRGLIISAIQKLNDGRSKLIESADFSFIDKLPRNRLDMFLNSIWDIPKYVQSKAKPIWEASYAIVEASCYIALAYSALNEPDSARGSLEQAEREVKVFQEKMGQIVHWLPPTSNWRESLETISQGILPNIHDLENIPQKTIIIEFQPKEISSPEGV